MVHILYILARDFIDDFGISENTILVSVNTIALDVVIKVA